MERETPEANGATSQTGVQGILIAFEGIDGSGKSTQARHLCATLEECGLSTTLLHEPGNTEYGDQIRQLFEHGRSVSPEEEMQLFLEDRRIDVRENILPALAEGRVVIMDRYYFSSMAYQGALGLDPELIREKNEAIAPRPHLTLILDVVPDTGVTRIRARRDVPNTFERVDYLLMVRELFLTFCGGREAEVQAEVWRQVSALLTARGLLPAG
jgi:dTMP kinase